MTERLIIQNFAGLNINIELGRINIFIGPQASGKSVCAKCLYWFKSFLPELLKSAARGEEKRAFDAAIISRFKKYFPGIWQSKENGLIRFEINEQFIQLENKSDRLKLSYSSIFQNAAATLRAEGREFKALLNKQLPNSSTQKRQQRMQLMLWEPAGIEAVKDELAESVADTAETNQLFILAGRSFFAAVKGAALTFFANTPVADPLLSEFLLKYERARQLNLNTTSTVTNNSLRLANHILRGEIAIKGEENYIVNNLGRHVPLSSASSGQQEAFSLLLLLLSLKSDDDEFAPHTPLTVYVEEPETHLFPESQRAMAQLMATIYYESVFTLQYVITTHSPYLLASFNNLIYAEQLAKTLHNQPAELKKLYRTVPPSQQLPLSDFQVYGFENGSARSLIDQESGLLSADLLDSASDVTADQFTALMALDPTTHP